MNYGVKMKNKKKIVEMLMEEHSCTARQAKAVVQFISRIEKAVDKGFTPTELNKQEVLVLRNQAAEEGSELTPSDMQDVVDLINVALAQEIKERKDEEWKTC
jgi:hypothetical protein